MITLINLKTNEQSTWEKLAAALGEAVIQEMTSYEIQDKSGNVIYAITNNLEAYAD